MTPWLRCVFETSMGLRYMTPWLRCVFETRMLEVAYSQ